MLSPSAQTIFPQNPSSGDDPNYFHAGISFTIEAQSYLKIGRVDRQQGSVVSRCGQIFKSQKKFPPKEYFENGNIQRRPHDVGLRP